MKQPTPCYRATWDYAFHSAAYLELARIASIRGDFSSALDRVNESLSTNSRNNSAIALKSSILRQLGRTREAIEMISRPASEDPLDFRIANELYLLLRESGDDQNAARALESVTVKMRDHVQNYLELAVAYLNDGLTDEAEDVLKRFRGKNPLVSYYLGYIRTGKET